MTILSNLSLSIRVDRQVGHCAATVRLLIRPLTMEPECFITTAPTSIGSTLNWHRVIQGSEIQVLRAPTMNLSLYVIDQVYTHHLLEPFYALDVKRVTLISSVMCVSSDSVSAAQLIVGIAGDISVWTAVLSTFATPLGDHVPGSSYTNLSQTHGRIISWWQTVLILYVF